MSATNLDSATVFRLFARECLRDGEVDDWERRRLLGLASLLRLDESGAREALLQVRDELRAGGLVAGAAAEPEALYRSILAAALADGIASPAEVRILLAVRQLLNVDDTIHASLLAELTSGPHSLAGTPPAESRPPPDDGESALFARARDLQAHVSMLALENRLGAPEEEAAETALRAALAELWEKLIASEARESQTSAFIQAVRSCADGLARCGETPGAALARLAQAETLEAGAAKRFPDKSRAEGWLADALVTRVHRKLEEGLFTEARVILQEGLGVVGSPDVKRRLEAELALATIPITPGRSLGGELQVNRKAVLLEGTAFAILASVVGLNEVLVFLAALVPLIALIEHVRLDDAGLDYRLGFVGGRISWGKIRTLASVWGFQIVRRRELRDKPMVIVGIEFALSDGQTAYLPVPAGQHHEVCRQLRDTLLGLLGPILLRRDLRLLERTGRLVLGDFTLDREGLTVEGNATDGNRRRFQWSSLESVTLGETRMLVRRRGHPGPPIELRTWSTPNLFTLHHILRERGLTGPCQA